MPLTCVLRVLANGLVPAACLALSAHTSTRIGDHLTHTGLLTHIGALLTRTGRTTSSACQQPLGAWRGPGGDPCHRGNEGAGHVIQICMPYTPPAYPMPSRARARARGGWAGQRGRDGGEPSQYPQPLTLTSTQVLALFFIVRQGSAFTPAATDGLRALDMQVPGPYPHGPPQPHVGPNGLRGRACMSTSPGWPSGGDSRGEGAFLQGGPRP